MLSGLQGWNYQAHFPLVKQNYRKIACYTIEDGPNQGRMAIPDIDSETVTLDGNWKYIQKLKITNNTTTADGEYKNLKMQHTAGTITGRNMRASIRVKDGRVAEVWITNDGDNWSDDEVRVMTGEVTGNPFANARFEVDILILILRLGIYLRCSIFA